VLGNGDGLSQPLGKKYPFIKSGPTNIGGAVFGKVGSYTHLEKKKNPFIQKCPINIGIVVFGNGGGLYPPWEKTVFLLKKEWPH
jgi:hypothetical protein